MIRVGATKAQDEDGIWSYIVLYKVLLEKTN